MNHYSPDRAAYRSSPPLEWRPDLARLSREIDAARAAGRCDRLALAEAECWIDLIDAELCARRNLPQDDTHDLKLWRTQLQLLVRKAGGGAN